MRYDTMLTGNDILGWRSTLGLTQEGFAELVRQHGGTAVRATVIRWESAGDGEISVRDRNRRVLRQMLRTGAGVNPLVREKLATQAA